MNYPHYVAVDAGTHSIRGAVATKTDAGKLHIVYYMEEPTTTGVLKQGRMVSPSDLAFQINRIVTLMENGANLCIGKCYLHLAGWNNQRVTEQKEFAKDWEQFQRANKRRQFILCNQALQQAALIGSTEEMRQQGCLVVDMGGGSTQFGLFQKGTYTTQSIHYVGGAQLTESLQQHTGLPVTMCEKLKTLRVHINLSSADNKCYKLRSQEGGEEWRVTRLELAAWAEAAVWEALHPALEKLEQKQWFTRPRHILLMGAASQLGGLAEWLENRTHAQVYAGTPTDLLEVKEAYEKLREPAYALLLGCLMEAQEDCKQSETKPNFWKKFNGMIRNSSDLFSDTRIDSKPGEKNTAISSDTL